MSLEMKKNIEISQKEQPEFDRDKDLDKKLLRVQKRLVTSLVGEDADEDGLKRKRKRTLSEKSEPKHLRIKISIGKGEKNSVLACSSVDSDNEKEYENSTNKEMRKTKSMYNPSIDKEEEFEDGNMRSRKSKFLRKEIPNQYVNGEGMRPRRSKSIHRETSQEVNECVVEENYEPAKKGHRSRSLCTRPDNKEGEETATESNPPTPTKYRSRSKSIDTKRASKRSSKVIGENPEPVVIKRSKPTDGGKRVKKDTLAIKDAFCWICHKEGIAWSCTQCPRTFHLKCAPETAHSMCADCSSAMIADSPQYSRLTLDQLSKLLKYALQRMKYVAGSEVFWRAVNPVEQPLYYQYVKNPMDLSLLEQNIDLQTYGSTGEFLADAKWILHNSIIFNTQQSPLTAAARGITKVCKQESQEIDKCPDCYLNAHTNPEWFIQVCNKPHLLIWARLKGFPFWPAKVLTVNFKSQMVDARFFGAHDKAWVPVRECFLLSENAPPSGAKKRGGDLEFAFDEMNNHVNEIRRKFGTFVLAPDKTPFIPENCDEHLDDMVPLWRIPPKTKQRQLKSVTVRRIVVNSNKVLDTAKSKIESPEDEMVRNLELMTPKTPLDDKLNEDTSTSTDYEDYVCNPRTPEHGYSIAPVEEEIKVPENGKTEKNVVEAESTASLNETATEEVKVVAEITNRTETEVQLIPDEAESNVVLSVENPGEGAVKPPNSSDEIAEIPKDTKKSVKALESTEDSLQTQKLIGETAEKHKIEESFETQKGSEITIENQDSKKTEASQEGTDKTKETQGRPEKIELTEDSTKKIVEPSKEVMEIAESDGKVETPSAVKIVKNLQTVTEPKIPVEVEIIQKNADNPVEPSIQVVDTAVSPVKIKETVKRSSVKISETLKTKPKIPVETPKPPKIAEKESEQSNKMMEPPDSPLQITKTPKSSVRVAESLKLLLKPTIPQETARLSKSPSAVPIRPKKNVKVTETRKKAEKLTPAPKVPSSPVKEQLTFNATKPIVSYRKKEKKPKENKCSDDGSPSSCSAAAPDTGPELVDVKQEIYDQYLYEESQRVADISSAIRSLECDRQPMVTIVDVNRLCAQRKGKDSSSSKSHVGKSSESNSNSNSNSNGNVRLSPEVSLVMVDSETEATSNEDSRQPTTGNKARKIFPRLPDRAESSVTISTSSNEISAKPSPRSMNVISVNTKNSDAQKILLKSLCLEERKQDKNETVREIPAEVSTTKPKPPGKEGPNPNTGGGSGAGATRQTKNIVVSSPSTPSIPSIPPNINGPLLISQNGQAFIANTSSPNITIAQNNLGQISLLQLTNLTSSIPNFVNLGNECNPVPPYGSVYTTPPPLSPFTNAPSNLPSAIIKPQTNGLINGNAENRQSPRPAMISVKSNSALLEPTAAISNCQNNQSPSVDAVMSQVHRLANDISESLKDTIKEIVLKFLQDGIPEGKLKLLNLEKKKMMIQHQKAMTQMRTAQDEQLSEFRSQMLEEKERELKKIKLEMEKMVEETKSKQWCSTCHKEALFYCCWNTSYCDYKCQEDHWPTHMTTCGQVRNQIETNTGVPNTTKKRSAPTKKQLRMNPSYSIVSYSGPSAKK